MTKRRMKDEETKGAGEPPSWPEDAGCIPFDIARAMLAAMVDDNDEAICGVSGNRYFATDLRTVLYCRSRRALDSADRAWPRNTLKAAVATARANHWRNVYLYPGEEYSKPPPPIVRVMPTTERVNVPPGLVCLDPKRLGSLVKVAQALGGASVVPLSVLAHDAPMAWAVLDHDGIAQADVLVMPMYRPGERYHVACRTTLGGQEETMAVQREAERRKEKRAS